VASVLQNESASLRSNAALLLLSNLDFNAFSHDKWRPSGSAGEFFSLENLHNASTPAGEHVGNVLTVPAGHSQRRRWPQWTHELARHVVV